LSFIKNKPTLVFGINTILKSYSNVFAVHYSNSLNISNIEKKKTNQQNPTTDVC